MSLYDDASLIMFPSGYKEDKIYSLKPTDGSGDLTFTRASTATRVNADGLIEKVRTNLLTYSNTFSNAAWIKTNQGVGSVAVVTPNYTTDPFGGNNAWRFECNLNGGTTTNDRSWMLNSFSPFANTTSSIYIKLNIAGSKTIILSNGGGDVQTITSTDWVRINILTLGSSGEFRIGLIGGTGSSDTLDCSIAFAQAEVSDFGPTEYIPTTSAAVSVGMLADVPRIDYTGGGCGKLLLESQRTNNVTYSEQLNNAAWALVNAGSASAPIVTANYGISPDGTQNAERVQFSRTGTTASDYSLLDRSTISTAAGVVSFYGKSLSGTQSILLYYGSVGQVFTLTTEWQRFSLYSPTTTTDLTIGTRGGTGLYYTGGSLTIDCLLWGFQKEAGSYVSSYVPTLASSVTRIQDIAFKTGISSLIGQTEGTIYLDFNRDSTNEGGLQIGNTDGPNDYLNSIILQWNINGVYANVFVAGVNQFPVTSSPVIGRHKIALAYKLNDFALYIDGVQIAVDAIGSIPSLSAVFLNHQNFGLVGSNVNNLLTFTTRLTNTQLASLTTL